MPRAQPNLQLICYYSSTLTLTQGLQNQYIMPLDSSSSALRLLPLCSSHLHSAAIATTAEAICHSHTPSQDAASQAGCSEGKWGSCCQCWARAQPNCHCHLCLSCQLLSQQQQQQQQGKCHCCLQYPPTTHHHRQLWQPGHSWLPVSSYFLGFCPQAAEA